MVQLESPRSAKQSAALFDERVLAIEDGILVDGEVIESGFAERAKLAARAARRSAKEAIENFHSVRHSPRTPLPGASPRALMPRSPRNAESARITPRGSMRTAGLHLSSVQARDRAAVESCRKAHGALDEVEAMSATQLIRRAVDLPSPRRAQSARAKPRLAAPASERAVPASESVGNPLFDALLQSAAAEVPRREAALGPDHPATIERVHRLGTLLHRAGRHEEALRHLHRVVRHRRAQLGEAHPKTAAAQADVVACAKAQKERAKAKAAAEETAEAVTDDTGAEKTEASVEVTVEAMTEATAEAEAEAHLPQVVSTTEHRQQTEVEDGVGLSDAGFVSRYTATIIRDVTTSAAASSR